MKISFFSNYLTSHQLPFCKAMLNTKDVDFTFVATHKFAPEEVSSAFVNMNQMSFVLCAYDNEEQIAKAKKLAKESDVVIFGSAPEVYLRSRMECDALTFRYSERIFKKGIWHAFTPRSIKNLIFNHRKYSKKQLYMLCASAYTAIDFMIAGAYIGKTYKWGYFPQVKEYAIDTLYKHKKSNRILWCGRFIDWKKPEDAIQIAKRLREDNYDFSLAFVGDGELEDKIQKKIMEYGLSDYVHILGPMSLEDVRHQMEEAGIYLFTSNFQEGWGAVLNEAMNSGCAIVASHAAGSVPFLVKHNENGLIYESGNIDDLYSKVKYLLDRRVEQMRLGRNAYCTITELWQAEMAAKRFIALVNEIKKCGFCDLYADGPCSKAGIIKNKWFNPSKIS